MNARVNLPSQLGRFGDEDRLQRNAEQYPEMKDELSPSEKLGVEAAKRLLLRLPLSHTTKSDPRKFEEQGIVTHTAASSDPTKLHSTLPLDTSLGLGEYTFMHLGGCTEKILRQKPSPP